MEKHRKTLAKHKKPWKNIEKHEEPPNYLGCENHCFNPLEPIKNSCGAIWIGRMHSAGGL
jgi:hypothetical protein